MKTVLLGLFLVLTSFSAFGSDAKSADSNFRVLQGDEATAALRANYEYLTSHLSYEWSSYDCALAEIKAAFGFPRDLIPDTFYQIKAGLSPKIAIGQGPYKGIIVVGTRYKGTDGPEGFTPERDLHSQIILYLSNDSKSIIDARLKATFLLEQRSGNLENAKYNLVPMSVMDTCDDIHLKR